jgi:hypothetical protein
MNPAVLDAFALIICAAEGPPAYPGVLGHEPDLSTARKHADAIDRAMNEVRKLAPNLGSYVAESDFFEEAWRQSFWEPNYATLLAVKDNYDPDICPSYNASLKALVAALTETYVQGVSTSDDCLIELRTMRCNAFTNFRSDTPR